MPSLNLKKETAKSSVFLLRENIRDLRYYAANLSDPANIARCVKAADLTSTSIKQLASLILKEDLAPDRNDETTPRVNPSAVLLWFNEADAENLCPECGRVKQ